MPDSPSILFINRVFPPDRGATGRCLADLAGRLAAAGWRVSVLADGRGPAEAPDGVAVVRTGTGGGTAGARGYAAALTRLTACGLTLPRHDVVVTMTDPPLLALAGPLLAARHGGAALHWCHDLFPALLPVLGVDVPGPLLAAAETAMARALRRHAGVVAIGRCMAARLAGLGVEPRRLAVLPNWADPRVRPQPRTGNPLRRRLGLGDRFAVAYCGNIGLAHPLAAVVEAAARTPEAEFLVIGDGRGHAAVAEAAAARALPNLRLLPFQPAARLAETLAAADLHLAAMDVRAAGLLVPCKVASVLAAGRPCLFLGPPGSEAARTVQEAGCGAVLAPGDGAGLAAAVRRYAGDPALTARHGRRAWRAAAAWDADRAAVRFDSLAAAAVRRPGGRARGAVAHGGSAGHG
ncbi:glycosyltransferase [Azospirillum sp. ST 5-10]|uniref:glycosyltransferase n=1 Tax=unclassified Azospirillum TaxID=2630922 RepID=UPI003F49B7F3